MNDNRRQRRWVIILALVGVLLMLVALSWGFMSWREEQLAAGLTPELVLQAFRDANYSVDDLQVGQGRGNMMVQIGSPERFIRFKARSGSQSDITDVSIVQYESKEQAEAAAADINRLNERMNSGNVYAFRRGLIVMAVFSEIYAERAKTAREFKDVFRSAAAR